MYSKKTELSSGFCMNGREVPNWRINLNAVVSSYNMGMLKNQ